MGITTRARARGWRTRILASVRAERPSVTELPHQRHAAAQAQSFDAFVVGRGPVREMHGVGDSPPRGAVRLR